MLLEFDSADLLDEFDDCDGMPTDYLISEFKENLALCSDCMNLVENLNEHDLVVLVLLALRQCSSGSAMET